MDGCDNISMKGNKLSSIQHTEHRTVRSFYSEKSDANNINPIFECVSNTSPSADYFHHKFKEKSFGKEHRKGKNSMNSSNVHDTIDRSISKTIAKLKLNTESTGYGAEDRIVPFNGLKESSDIRKNLLGQYEIMLDQESSDHLVGDFSMSHCLPFITTGAKHEDLKSIKPSTVVRILDGDFDDIIGHCVIIDCRYPFEYEAGHIVGSVNIYSKDKVMEFLTSEFDEYSTLSYNAQNPKRHIVIFHCEFSSERGPNLMRFFRNQDRFLNEESYPALKFPEIYLLENGYKEFYNEQSAYCKPMHYLPMCHPDHKKNVIYYRAKSKLYDSNLCALSDRKEHKRLLRKNIRGNLFT